MSYGKQIHAHVQADDDGSVHKEKIYMYIYQNFLEILLSSDQWDWISAENGHDNQTQIRVDFPSGI